MAQSRKRPIDKPQSLEVGLIEDPSGYKCKVIRYSAGEWSKEIHIKHLRPSRYGNHWNGAHKIMSPMEADIWLTRLNEIIEKAEWKTSEGGVMFWTNSPSLRFSDTGNDLIEPEIFLISLRDVVQALRDKMGS